MITVDLSIIHPATGEPLTGTITFTPTSAHSGQVITHDGAVVSGVPITVDLATDSTVTLHPSPPGWWYTVRGKDETGYTFTDHRAVPSQLPVGQESIALTDLRRVDPKAGGLSVTPEPEWQQWAKEIIALGGIPGESAKETAEKVEGVQLTDQEFVTLITGPRGDAGADGQDGLTALDFHRQNVGDPAATWDDFEAWLQKGLSALDQWAKYTGTSNPTVEDMVADLEGDSAFQVWKSETAQPDATSEDYLAAIKGDPGADSTVPGRSAYDSVVDSGYDVTEQEFADAMMAGSPSWEVPTLYNGWGEVTGLQRLRVRVVDGVVHVHGAATPPSGNPWTWRAVYLPPECTPTHLTLIPATTDQGDTVWFEIRVAESPRGDEGSLHLHSDHASESWSYAYFATTFVGPDASVRPRIPGPKGDTGDTGDTGPSGQDATAVAVTSPVADDYGNNVSYSSAYILAGKIAVVQLSIRDTEISQAGTQSTPLVKLRSDLGSETNRDQWTAWVHGDVGIITGQIRSDGELVIRWAQDAGAVSVMAMTLTYAIA